MEKYAPPQQYMPEDFIESHLLKTSKEKGAWPPTTRNSFMLSLLKLAGHAVRTAGQRVRSVYAPFIIGNLPWIRQIVTWSVWQRFFDPFVNSWKRLQDMETSAIGNKGMKFMRESLEIFVNAGRTAWSLLEVAFGKEFYIRSNMWNMGKVKFIGDDDTSIERRVTFTLATAMLAKAGSGEREDVLDHLEILREREHNTPLENHTYLLLMTLCACPGLLCNIAIRSLGTDRNSIRRFRRGWKEGIDIDLLKNFDDERKALLGDIQESEKARKSANIVAKIIKEGIPHIDFLFAYCLQTEITLRWKVMELNSEIRRDLMTVLKEAIDLYDSSEEKIFYFILLYELVRNELVRRPDNIPKFAQEQIGFIIETAKELGIVVR